MQPASIEIVGVGEVLWDLLPQGRQLGGAPFNFVFHAHQLGHASAMVSRVGADDLGREIQEAVQRLGLSDAYLQSDPLHPTGTVTVAVDEGGQPTFTITPDVAYDHLAWDAPVEALFGRAQAVCFGTLAQRHPEARAAIRQALRTARHALVVYDVNLRQHFYSREVIEESLAASRWVKLNEDELALLHTLLDLSGTTQAALLADLRRRYRLELAALTRGGRGCLVQTDDEEVAVPGLPVQVIDTIGAGDAFTAGLLVHVLEGRPVAEATRLRQPPGRPRGGLGGWHSADRPGGTGWMRHPPRRSFQAQALNVSGCSG
jgi:fructokinase